MLLAIGVKAIGRSVVKEVVVSTVVYVAGSVVISTIREKIQSRKQKQVVVAEVGV